MRRLIRLLIGLAIIGGVVFWAVTMPDPLDESALAGIIGDAAAGKDVFNAAGCASCHSAPKAEGEAKLVLSGGQAFPSDFGTFIAPNISPDPTHGIGGWSDLELVNAVTRGVSPDGAHYYPAFPYGSYNKADLGDVVNLVAYLRTLPASDVPSQPHQVGFPFNIRRSLGGWKFLFLRDEWVMANAPSEEVARGRYLVEALGHCGECHTPRNALGGMDYGNWLGGAPIPGSEKGRTPPIGPGKLDWSAPDIAEYLSSGFTPEFDTAGGHMVPVVENFAQLPQSDRDAVAAYLKALPPGG